VVEEEDEPFVFELLDPEVFEEELEEVLELELEEEDVESDVVSVVESSLPEEDELDEPFVELLELVVDLKG